MKYLSLSACLLTALLLVCPPVRAEEKPGTATLAGGCFWCVESAFEGIPGVMDVVSGYADGSGDNPTYDDYAEKGHVEAVEILYDPAKISYDGLLDIFWRQINPADGEGQFVDRGQQYRPAIFYHNEEQKKLAEASRDKIAASGKFEGPIAVEILPASKFYRAEEYHQDYYRKNPIRYKYYRFRSGRDQFLKKTWGARPENAAAHSGQTPA